MDIFRLLSRGTKGTQKPSSGASTTHKLPSAGATANPQLFHDSVPESRGQKRKLDEVKDDTKVVADEDYNYFNNTTEKKGSSKRQAVSHDHEATGHRSKEAVTPAPELLEESQCKQILKSHRLKVMLLPSPDEAPKMKKKSSKKRKEEPKVKEEPKQIYPQPLNTFDEMQTIYGITRKLRENIAAQGYKLPTEVQMGTLPLLLKPEVALKASSEGSKVLEDGAVTHLLNIAPTGSGKTVAFMIPVVNSMIQRRKADGKEAGHRLEAVVVAPTKELASQIVNEGRKLALGTGIRVVLMRKGMSVAGMSDEKDELHEDDESAKEDSAEDSDGSASVNEKSKKRSKQPASKADILVTTPLTLLHALGEGSSKASLPTVRHLVLDEADVLLDALFRDQTLGIWDACTNPTLQLTMWSATMGSNIEALASEKIYSRAQSLELTRKAHIIRVVVGLKDSAIPNIEHRVVYTANEPGKLLALRQLLHGASTIPLRPPFLVFTQTIPRATALHSELLYDIPAEAGGSSRIAVLHSSLSDSVRSNIMTRFRNGEIWILITTDILSRGVDFRGINGVVNYDIPTSGASYIHRVGRTGRAGREGGVAVTFYSKEDIPYFKAIANIIAASEKAAGKTGSEVSVSKWLLDSLPTPSKNEKKRLKMHGVEERRVGLPGKGGDRKAKKKAQISTKSAYERRLENKKKGAIEGSKRRAAVHQESNVAAEAVKDEEWGGFDE
jgi:ATP-dependent RNA helicase DDX52/ROK1